MNKFLQFLNHPGTVALTMVLIILLLAVGIPRCQQIPPPPSLAEDLKATENEIRAEIHSWCGGVPAVEEEESQESPLSKAEGQAFLATCDPTIVTDYRVMLECDNGAIMARPRPERNCQFDGGPDECGFDTTRKEKVHEIFVKLDGDLSQVTEDNILNWNNYIEGRIKQEELEVFPQEETQMPVGGIDLSRLRQT